MNDDKLPNQPPDPIDLEVGERLRDARRTRAMSQEALGDRLNLTAHEVQRLEKGLDRLSAVMLIRAAEAIGISPTALLPETPQTSCSTASSSCNADVEPSSETELLTAFHRIGSRDLQSTVVDMARKLADEGSLGSGGSSAAGDGEQKTLESCDLGDGSA